jgi:prevent-host-death family protein
MGLPQGVRGSNNRSLSLAQECGVTVRHCENSRVKKPVRVGRYAAALLVWFQRDFGPLQIWGFMPDTGCVLVQFVRVVHAMTRLNVSKAREEFPEVVNRAAYGKERTIVSRRGKDLAAVIPIEDLRLLERLAGEEMDRIDIEDARAALKEAEEKGTIPLRDLMRELGD